MLRFYHEEPNPLEALFYITFQGWKGFRKSRRLSQVLRKIFENSGLAKIETNEEQQVIVYPYTEVKEDPFNLHLTFHMIAGQTAAEWERKLDAFSHALGADLVKSSIKRGIVELTVQHTAMSTTEVIYKEDDRHFISLGYKAGGVLEWEFDKHPHALIVGLTGTGKSTFVRNLLTQFREDWILKIVDGKYVEFTFMTDLGYDVATSPQDFMKYVDEAQQEVDDRFRQLQETRNNNYKDMGMKPYFLLCDEFIFLAEEVPNKKKQGEAESERDKLFSKLRDISLRGRAAGVFLILILQRPDSSFMPTIVRDNLMCKIVLGGSQTALEMAFGSEHKKLSHLDQGQGYAMIDELIPFMFPNYEQSQFVSDLQGRITDSASKESSDHLIERKKEKEDHLLDKIHGSQVS